MKSIYLSIPSTGKENSRYVLATVTGAGGSTPQKPGSSALFDSSRLVAGTVGGGILEGKVQEIATDPANKGRSGLYVFKLDNSVADGEDALCGGRISILIDADLQIHSNVFSSVKDSLSNRIPGVLITRVAESIKKGVSITRFWMTEKSHPHITNGFMAEIEKVALDMLSLSKPGDFREIKLPFTENDLLNLYFLELVFPPARLLIAGAGHIGKALAKIGQMLDFEVTVVDDRAEFANSDNIPWADHIIAGNIRNAVSQTVKGKDLFIVIVTRGHRDDADALRACIGSDTGYIGMIGSRNKVALVRREFIEKGWATDGLWKRIHAPIGLDINSKTVEEIAVSIAAQLVKVKNGPKGKRH